MLCSDTSSTTPCHRRGKPRSLPLAWGLPQPSRGHLSSLVASSPSDAPAPAVPAPHPSLGSPEFAEPCAWCPAPAPSTLEATVSAAGRRGGQRLSGAFQLQGDKAGQRSEQQLSQRFTLRARNPSSLRDACDFLHRRAPGNTTVTPTFLRTTNGETAAQRGQ